MKVSIVDVDTIATIVADLSASEDDIAHDSIQVQVDTLLQIPSPL